MKIVDISNGTKRSAVRVTALLGAEEYRQLAGHLDNLFVFCTQIAKQQTSVTKTGARHSYAKYLLFPAKLRRLFPTESYDFSRVRCGTATYKDELIILYRVPKKSIGASSEDE